MAHLRVDDALDRLRSGQAAAWMSDEGGIHLNGVAAPYVDRRGAYRSDGWHALPDLDG